MKALACSVVLAAFLFVSSPPLVTPTAPQARVVFLMEAPSNRLRHKRHRGQRSIRY